MLKRSESKNELTLEQFSEIFEELEDQAIDLWFLLLLSKNNNSSEFFWVDIAAIQRTQFSIFNQMPSVAQMILDKASSSRSFFYYADSLFSGSHRQFQKCGSTGFLSPLKARQLASVRQTSDGDEAYAFSFGKLMADYQDLLFKKRDVLIDKCQMQFDLLVSAINEQGIDDPAMLLLTERYSDIIRFSTGSNGAFPFDKAKVASHLDRVYSDLQSVTESVEKGVLDPKGLNFWRLFFQNLYALPELLPVIRVLPVEAFKRWGLASDRTAVSHFEYSFRTEPEAFEDYARVLFGSNKSKEIQTDLDDSVNNINEILRSEAMLTNIVSQLEDRVLITGEVYACAEVIEKNVLSVSEVGPKSSKKRNRENCEFVSKAELRELHYLKDYASSLYIFFGVICQVLNHSSCPEYDEVEFIDAHNSQFIELSSCLAWARSINSLIGSYDHSNQLFLEIAQQSILKLEEKLKILADARQNFMTRLSNRLWVNEDLHDSFEYAEKEMLTLLNPSWDEWCDKQSSFRNYPELFERTNDMMSSVSSLLGSIELTNTHRTQDSVYPPVSEKVVARLRESQRQIREKRSTIAERVILNLKMWLKGVQLACFTTETTLAELVQNYYRLGLFSSNQAIVLDCLGDFSVVMMRAKFERLAAEVIALTPTVCQAAMKRKRTSPILYALVQELMRQKRQVAEELKRVPALVDSLSRYSSLSSSESFDQFSFECCSMVRRLEDQSKKSSALEDDLALVNDLLRECSWATEIPKLSASFSEANIELAQMLKQQQRLMLFLSETDYHPESVQRFQALTDFLLNTRRVFQHTLKAYNVVCANINCTQNPHPEDENHWRKALQEHSAPLKMLISETELALSGNHKVAEALNACQRGMQDMGYEALSLSKRYTKRLLDKMTTLSLRFQQQSIVPNY